MIPVAITIRFVTPCLGPKREPDLDKFPRDSHGNIIFLNSWWTSIFEFGADAAGLSRNLAGQVLVHMVVDAKPEVYKRFYQPNKFTRHEAFLPGSELRTTAYLPDGLLVEQFRKILELAGAARGISPYGWRDGYGRFTVEKVEAKDC